MKTSLIVLTFLVLATGLRLHDASAQARADLSVLAPHATTQLFTDPYTTQQERRFGEKSPALAGILSFLIFPGTGSFYAGNSGHGTRHLVIGGASLIGFVIGLGAACDDGFDLCDEDHAGYAVGGIFGLVYLANWIWGGITAIGDANAYNRDLRAGLFQLEPALVRLTNVRDFDGTPVARTGVRILKVDF